MVCTILARITVLTTFCLFLPSILQCEQSAPWRFGVSGGAGVQFHSSGPAIVLPPATSPFETTQGPALALGLRIERLLLPWLYTGLAVDVQAWNGTFTAEEPSFFVVNGVGTPGVITHSLDLSTTSFGITPSLTIPIAPAFSLNTGVQLSYFLANSYEQSQAVTEPADLPFVYGDIRSAGEIDNMQKLSISLTAALRYSIPLGGPLALEPELRGYYALSSLMEGTDWRNSGVRGAVALVYAPVEQPPVVLRDTVYRRDTMQVLVGGLERERLVLTDSSRNEVRQERDDVVLITLEVEESYLREIPRPSALLAAAVDVRFLQKSGEETQSTTVMVEGKMSRHYLPLLPYVFFDEGSAELPEKYRQSQERPSTGSAMLDMYYHLLDTVGARMKAHPRARLVLTGTNADAGVEKGNEELSRRRAEAVREYLVRTWNIAPERIRVVARNLPRQPSTAASGEAMEENRRVEVTSEDDHIFAPVVLSNVEIVADPPLVRFYPDVVSEAGTASWRLSIALEGTPIREFSGGGSPPSVIEWDIESTPAAARLLAGDPAPMQYEFSATDIEGAVSQPERGTIRFQQAQGIADSSFIRRTTDRFSLILFDFNTAALSPANRAVVRLVRSVVAPRDSVAITGFSDATGDEAYNQRLSQRRAEAISSVVKMSRMQVAGRGVDPELPQYLPEARFYSRRVDVVREK